MEAAAEALQEEARNLRKRQDETLNARIAATDKA
jgi:hypothetical protein